MVRPKAEALPLEAVTIQALASCDESSSTLHEDGPGDAIFLTKLMTPPRNLDKASSNWTKGLTCPEPLCIPCHHVDTAAPMISEIRQA